MFYKVFKEYISSMLRM